MTNNRTRAWSNDIGKQIKQDQVQPEVADVPEAPSRLTGRDFQQILNDQHAHYYRLQMAHVVHYGTQCVRVPSKPGEPAKVMEIKSLCDYGGVYPLSWGSIEFAHLADAPPIAAVDFDAKVCSQSKMDLQDYRKGGTRTRQLNHLVNRAAFGVTAFFLIHFNGREFKTKPDELPQTWVFPVAEQHPFWAAFAMGETSSINREDCRNYGTRVQWRKLAKARTLRPDWLGALTGVGK